MGGVSGEIIVVDDNSPDGTSSAVRLVQKKHGNLRLLCRKIRRGKGSAVADGFDLAKYDFLCMIDADFQYNPDDIFRLLKVASNSGKDIVIGKRIYQNLSLKRKMFSMIFRSVQKAILRLGVNDTQSGLKIIRKEVLHKIKITESGFAFDIELLLKARREGFSVIEVPIKFHERKLGSSKVSLLGTSWELFLRCIQLKLAIDIFGRDR